MQKKKKLFTLLGNCKDLHFLTLLHGGNLEVTTLPYCYKALTLTLIPSKNPK